MSVDILEDKRKPGGSVRRIVIRLHKLREVLCMATWTSVLGAEFEADHATSD